MSGHERVRVGAEMQRLTWPEMLEYWRLHDERWGNIDYDRDPDGLSNICAAGQPIWLGSYYARFQRLVYEKLLALLPQPTPDTRALDVGCGAGRWCVLLAGRGYTVTGIDIQPTLIRENRRRFPHIEFVEVPLQEFTHEEPFDLVSCVTVLQHLPFEEQLRGVARLRELTASGGHALVLENIRHQAPDHFSRGLAEWRSMFESNGFRLLAGEPYNYSPALRLSAHLRGLVSASGASGSREVAVASVVTPRDPGKRHDPPLRALLRLGHRTLLRLAVALDTRVEPHLIGRRTRLEPTNCGFLFQAV